MRVEFDSNTRRKEPACCRRGERLACRRRSGQSRDGRNASGKVAIPLLRNCVRDGRAPFSGSEFAPVPPSIQPALPGAEMFCDTPVADTTDARRCFGPSDCRSPSGTSVDALGGASESFQGGRVNTTHGRGARCWFLAQNGSQPRMSVLMLPVAWENSATGLVTRYFSDKLCGYRWPCSRYMSYVWPTALPRCTWRCYIPSMHSRHLGGNTTNDKGGYMKIAGDVKPSIRGSWHAGLRQFWLLISPCS